MEPLICSLTVSPGSSCHDGGGIAGQTAESAFGGGVKNHPPYSHTSELGAESSLDVWEKQNTACHVSKQMVSPPSVIAHSELVGSEATQEAENACHPAACSLQPLPTVSPEGAQDGETRDAGPGQLRRRSRSDFSQPRLLCLPHTQKSAKFLSLRYLVFFD